MITVEPSQELEYRSDALLWWQDSSLLNLFLQADQALPVEQRIMSGTKFPLRALRQGYRQDYVATLTAPKKAVALSSPSWSARGLHGLFPSHDMIATLEIRARSSHSRSNSVFRQWGGPTTLMADLGDRNLVDRLAAATAAGLDPIEDSRYTVLFSSPAIRLYGPETHSRELDQRGDFQPLSFDWRLRVKSDDVHHPWKFAFEVPDTGREPGYNERLNEELIEDYGQLIADITLHLDFQARATAPDQEMAQAGPSFD